MPNKPNEKPPAPVPAAAAATATAPADLIAVRAGRMAALIVAERVTQELPGTPDPLDRIELRLERDHARTIADDLRLIEIDLVASGTRIARLAGDDVTGLVLLAAGLDEAIVRGKLLNLGLDTVGEILESVVRVRDILHA